MIIRTDPMIYFGLPLHIEKENYVDINTQIPLHTEQSLA